jgi:hypothetical protein
MRHFVVILLMAIISLPERSNAQLMHESVVLKDKYNFASPLDIPLYLSGNFGEPRSTHFHTGLDIRTGGKIGMNVNAIDDGYVSRIGVSSKGYGKVLYVTHPQHQLTSVYAHLNDFYGEIEKVARGIQYATLQSEFDTVLPPKYLKVKKGDVIAASGNTGGSGGPHLHFEIRDSKNDEAINPELVGFTIKDPFPPLTYSIKLCDLGRNKINATGKIIPLKRVGNHFVPGFATIRVNSQQVGISVQAIDKSFNSIGRNGIYQMKLKQDGQLIFESKMNRIHFDDWRYSYSYSDCGERMRRDAIYHKCFVDECNEAKIYEVHQNNGAIVLKPGKQSEIEVVLYDFTQNKTSIIFQLEYDQENNFFIYKKPNLNSPMMDCHTENIFEQENLKVIIPELCLADHFRLQYAVKPSTKYFSDLHQIHHREDPLLDSIYIEIKPRNLPPELRSKAMLAFMDNGVLKSAGGSYKKGNVATWFAKFGTYVVVVDTTPPKILSTNIVNNKKLNGNLLSFHITDYLSGIKSYQVIFDGQWLAMDYDLKSHHLFYRPEKPLAPGLHKVYIEMTDFKKNTSRYSYTFLK